jgi:membrane protease YdiL (CAAX protease family)
MVDWAMGWLLLLVGVAVVGIAWTLVRDGGLDVWAVMTPAYVALGALALLVGSPRLSGDPRLTGLPPDRWVATGPAIGLGLLVGLALFLGTRVFVGVMAPRWPAFARQTATQYEQRTGVAFATALGGSIAVVLGEELFWRGWVTPAVSASWSDPWVGPVVGAAATGIAYVVANLPSRSLPIVAGAIVGGAVWGVLPILTGGIAASLACHVVWTLLMLVLPPRAARGMMAP